MIRFLENEKKVKYIVAIVVCCVNQHSMIKKSSAALKSYTDSSELEAFMLQQYWGSGKRGANILEQPTSGNITFGGFPK